MKLLGFVSAIASIVLFASAPAIAATDPLPNSGTYFITSVASDQALQPVAPSLGQNVLLYEFNKGGTQKWQITRKIDAKTSKPSNRYTIRLAGENEDLNFQPHPSVDTSAILGMDKEVFVLEPGDAGIAVKSVAKNGDAMYVYGQSGANSETRFGPDDGSKKFRWNFVSAN